MIRLIRIPLSIVKWLIVYTVVGLASFIVAWAIAGK